MKENLNNRPHEPEQTPYEVLRRVDLGPGRGTITVFMTGCITSGKTSCMEQLISAAQTEPSGETEKDEKHLTGQ